VNEVTKSKLRAGWFKKDYTVSAGERKGNRFSLPVSLNSARLIRLASPYLHNSVSFLSINVIICTTIRYKQDLSQLHINVPCTEDPNDKYSPINREQHTILVYALLGFHLHCDKM